MTAVTAQMDLSMIIHFHLYVHLESPSVPIIMKKLKQWWSTIPPKLTKRTIPSHLKSLNIKRPWHRTLEI